MAKYRKRPVIIEAIQWTGTNTNELLDFIKPKATLREGSYKDASTPNRSIIIETLEGEHWTSINDWVIKGVKGEFYPCKLGIFEATYEAID